MMTRHNRHVLLAPSPNGAVDVAELQLMDEPNPTPGEGELLVRAQHLSNAPYLREGMNDVEGGYAAGRHRWAQLG